MRLPTTSLRRIYCDHDGVVTVDRRPALYFAGVTATQRVVDDETSETVIIAPPAVRIALAATEAARAWRRMSAVAEPSVDSVIGIWSLVLANPLVFRAAEDVGPNSHELFSRALNDAIYLIDHAPSPVAGHSSRPEGSAAAPVSPAAVPPPAGEVRTTPGASSGDVKAPVHLTESFATADAGGATVGTVCGVSVDGLPDLKSETLAAFGLTPDRPSATCARCVDLVVSSAASLSPVPTPSFKPGDRVRVKENCPATPLGRHGDWEGRSPGEIGTVRSVGRCLACGIEECIAVQRRPPAGAWVHYAPSDLELIPPPAAEPSARADDVSAAKAVPLAAPLASTGAGASTEVERFVSKHFHNEPRTHGPVDDPRRFNEVAPPRLTNEEAIKSTPSRACEAPNGFHVFILGMCPGCGMTKAEYDAKGSVTEASRG